MKRIFFFVMAPVMIMICGVLNADAIERKSGFSTQQNAPAPAVKEQLKIPDLKVKLELTIGKRTDPNKGECDTIDGDFTVTNIGDGPAGEFWVTVRYQDEYHDWFDFGSWPLPGLMPGQSETQSCGIQLNKCPNDTKTVGFEVIVDSRNHIKEKNEGNNTVKKTHPSFLQMKKTPVQRK